MEEERPAAEPAQARRVSVSASPSRGADAGTGHQQHPARQDQAGLSVQIECHQSTSWHGPVLKEVIVSFKRRPLEEPRRSVWAHGLWEATLLQQQDGLEHREPQRQGQGSLLRRSGRLDDTPGQVSANDTMGQPETGRDRATSLPWTIGYTAPQQPQVTHRRFTEGTLNNQVILERLGAQAPSSEPVAWTEEQECEDAMGPELSEEEEWEDALDVELSEAEEWEDAIDTELCQGTDDIGSSPVHHRLNSLGLQDNRSSHPGPKAGPSCHMDEGTVASTTARGSEDKECLSGEDHEGEGSTATVTPAAQEEPSQVGEQAAAHPDAGQALTYTIPFSAFLDTLVEGNQTWRRKALSVLWRALAAAQGKGEQKRQHPAGCKEALPEPAQSIRAEGLDKDHPVKQGPGWQLEEAEPDLELSMKEATEAGTPAGPAFRSPSPTVIDALARERRTSVFKSAPRALHTVFTAIHKTGKQEQQQPTGRALDQLDTGQYFSSEVLSKATIVIERPNKQIEGQRHLEHSTDATQAVTARAAGAVSPAHAPHSPTADGLAVQDTAQYIRDELLSKAVIVMRGSEGLTEQQRGLEQGTAEGMRVTAPVEGTERPGHTEQSRTDDAPVFLDANDCIRTEVVKKAVLMVQKPFEYPEEPQDEELSPEESTGAERPAGRAQSPPVPTVINTVQQRWRSLVWKALRALHLGSTTTSGTGERKKKKPKKHPRADATDVLNTAECIRRDGQDKATLELQASSQQMVEEQDMENSRAVSSAVTPTAAGAERRARETHSPTAHAPAFLNAADYIRTEAVKKAILVVQRPLEELEELWELEQSVHKEPRPKARGEHTESPAHVLHSPRADGPLLLGTDQDIPAPAEGTEGPGHTEHSHPDDALVFLDANDYLHTEVVKKAVLVVQRPLEEAEEQ